MTMVAVLDIVRQYVLYLGLMLFIALYGAIFLDAKFSVRRVILAAVLDGSMHVFATKILMTHPLYYALHFLSFFIVCWVLWRPRERGQYLRHLLIIIALSFVFDSIAMLLLFSRYTMSDLFYYGGEITDNTLFPHRIPVFLGAFFLPMAAGLLLCWGGKKLYTRYFRGRNAKLFYILRPIVFLVPLIMVYIYYGFSIDTEVLAHGTDGFWNNIGEVIVLSLLIICILSYIFQDLAQWRLYNRNSLLKTQNETYEALLKDLRSFRHNIANMIYGMEGAILTGNIEEVERYYAQMAEKCARINNENIISVNRLTSPHLAALLLQKLERASQTDLPIYLTVETDIDWRGNGATLCEIVGNLIDNAIEAASESASPRIEIYMRKEGRYSEIIVSNTYAETADLSFLGGDYRSHKANHAGVGLLSIKRNLEREKQLSLSQVCRGRFIESILCLYAS